MCQDMLHIGRSLVLCTFLPGHLPNTRIGTCIVFGRCIRMLSGSLYTLFWIDTDRPGYWYRSIQYHRDKIYRHSCLFRHHCHWGNQTRWAGTDIHLWRCNLPLCMFPVNISMVCPRHLDTIDPRYIRRPGTDWKYLIHKPRLQIRLHSNRRLFSAKNGDKNMQKSATFKLTTCARIIVPLDSAYVLLLYAIYFTAFGDFSQSENYLRLTELKKSKISRCTSE